MQKKSLSFTERMAGHASTLGLSLPATDKQIQAPLPASKFVEAEHSSQRMDFEFTLTITLDDIDAFVADPNLRATVAGAISSPLFGGTRQISNGLFNLFLRPNANTSASTNLNTAKEMHYTLFFEDAVGTKLTLFGYKEILHDDWLELWQETTTLYFYIWRGHSEYRMREKEDIVSLGVLHISVGDFLHQISTLRASDESLIEQLDTKKKFLNVFAENLWEAYAPAVFGAARARWSEHLYPVNTTVGVVAKNKSIIGFDTEDGLSLVLQRFKAKESKNVVLLLHGLTNGTDMFMMPEHYNLVNYLHANGFGDVWSLDWRGSNRYPYNLIPNRYTVDDIAKYDLPAAIEAIKKSTGADVKIHIIGHCVGSMAAICSMAAGHTHGIQSFIGNSVTLTPTVRWQALIKVIVGPDILEYVFRYPYISPKIPYLPGVGFGKWIYLIEKIFRHECSEPACHMMSFMWGFGFPSFFNHENLHPTTHRRLADLFGGVGFNYYRHIRKMIFKKEAVRFKKDESADKLPESYLQNIINVPLPPLLLISGGINKIFPGSNKLAAAKIKELKPAQEVHYSEVPNYGHQDIFIGKNAHVDVFPKFIEFLNRHKV